MPLERSRSFPTRLVVLAGVLAVAAVAASEAPAGRIKVVVHDELLADRAEIDRDLRVSQRPADLWLRRSAIQTELGDWNGALLDLQRAARAGADGFDVALGEAAVHLAAGDQAKAEASATRAILRDPDDRDARVIRARARVSLGLYREASDDFGRAIALSPVRPLDLVFARAAALADAPDLGPRAALDSLEEEMARRGQLPSLVLLVVEYERQLHLHHSALARLRALRAQGWSPVRCGLLSGDIQQDAGRTDDARASWHEALASLESRPTRRRTTRAALRVGADLRARLEDVGR